MTTIEISDELAAALKGLAAGEGLALDAWLEQLVADNAETAEEESARVEWLCAPAREGSDAIERGEYSELKSPEELDAFMDQICDEVKADLAPERRVIQTA